MAQVLLGQRDEPLYYGENTRLSPHLPRPTMIQSFRAELPWPADQLPPAVEALETALQPHLPSGAELLRWAVVAIKNDPQAKTPSLVCEGAWILV